MVGVMPFNPQKQIGNNLRRLRAERGETQGVFSSALGIHQTTLSLWESGDRLPSLNELVRKLERAGIDPRRIFLFGDGDDVDPFPHDPDIDRVVIALRRLSPELRTAIVTLVETLQRVAPGDISSEEAELRDLMRQLNPSQRAGVLGGVKQFAAVFLKRDASQG
ncbi:MAG: helix-turn-helix transcriptional regulator [Leptolyngbyaceae bacterium]|nr:helix-turn-helix transcriptional regulator [Leptolyngbyaceae bacterium]